MSSSHSWRVEVKALAFPRCGSLKGRDAIPGVGQQFDGAVDLVVGDLSFISLTAVLPALVGVARAGASLVLLVKPQFEAGRAEASKGKGIIRDPAIWLRVLGEVADAAEDAGAGLVGATVSPIRGGNGNVEFLIHLVVGGSPAPVYLDSVIQDVEAPGGAWLATHACTDALTHPGCGRSSPPAGT